MLNAYINIILCMHGWSSSLHDYIIWKMLSIDILYRKCWIIELEDVGVRIHYRLEYTIDLEAVR